MLVLSRGAFLALNILAGFLLYLIVRLAEWPVFGKSRPLSAWITQLVCRNAIVILGLKYRTRGRPMKQKGAVVANHAGWIDIFALNAGQRIFFVSKAEVASWPGIGWLARVTGTVFISRRGSEAKRQQQLFEERLRMGHRLCFFPEGTSTDALRVLPFKSTLFEAFYTHGLDRVLHIQPVTVIWRAPAGEDPRFYGWWADMDFASHLIQVLSARRRGAVEIIWHPEVPVDAFANRKELAAYCERVIRTAHPLAVA
nr:lysophospholipid acyltransferase family protein [Pseudogemmobacter humi]